MSDIPSDDRRFPGPISAVASKMLYVPAMNIRLLARRALMSSPLLLLTGLAFGGTAAAAPNNIEGVWSFSGGAVVIHPESGSTLQGVVVGATTTFATCPHPEGQVMWTNMQPQSDGSYWGLHQWYKGTTCEEDPVLGRTAWRVLTNSSGERTLKVCFNTPGGETQPTIAPSGIDANVTYACTESKALASLSETKSSGNTTVSLPTAKGCVKQTSLKIALKDPKYDPLKEVVIKIKGKKVADVKGIKRLKKGITLKKLPTGTYKVSVVATTVLKQHLSGSQTYKSCTKGSGKIKLRHVKKHS
jgi:hypothetical protein